jgi:hypothetical protein
MTLFLLRTFLCLGLRSGSLFAFLRLLWRWGRSRLVHGRRIITAAAVFLRGLLVIVVILRLAVVLLLRWSRMWKLRGLLRVWKLRRLSRLRKVGRLLRSSAAALL